MYRIYMDFVIRKTKFPLKQDKFYLSIKFKGGTDFTAPKTRTNENTALEKKPKHTVNILSYIPIL